ncbi:Thioredoxin reductase [uncultured Roseburia sp.]|uniref:FAD-dependent oxidoreductase n=1 Tax=Brotonthovivens ammoniilytica TaxID=2981725 RepID=A0ABT2THF6_9FIRM|nr:FAD-dependent oxidoreductase [Brotonthovivens ammoniilytica]MCU6761117.1 FAD-dependent oxidoreductase [Brotonthovivens ammoniilytica]SCI19403.1 Thioredoxin reductase [uncultured Roseburia sp.]
MKQLNMEQVYDSIIIGGGPAGLSAAIYLARAKYRVLVVEKEKLGGQITITSEVVNYPGILRTSGEELTDSMKKQAQSFGAEFLLAEVKELGLTEDVKEVVTSKGSFQTLGVVLATGASPRQIGFKGEMEFRGRGVAYCATCDGEFFTGMELFVLGGGYAAAEEAVFLTKYAKKVTIMVRKEAFSCAGSIVDEVLAHPDIEVKFHTEIVEAGGDGKLQYAVFKDNLSGSTWEYRPLKGEGFGIFVFAGYEPASGLFRELVETRQGYLVTDMNQKTSLDGVYGAGDVCVKNLRQVVTAVSDGAVAATSLEKYLSALYEAWKLPKRLETGKASTDAGGKETGQKAWDTKETDEKNGAADAEEGSFITSSMSGQLKSLFEKFQNSLNLELLVDDTPVSKEVQQFALEITRLSEKIQWSVKQIGDEEEEGDLPAIRICDAQNHYLGTAFHGVPGGHEFNSFIIALYNAAGPGQQISEDIRNRIVQINQKIKIQVVVSLSCTMCPDLVMAVQRIALENTLIQADIYDMAHFPALRERYQIMSVPCMIINEKEVYFGKKNLEELLDILEKL